MRGRPVLAEEFDRILAAVPKVRPKDTAVWQRYLTGLWWSGLRLEESTIVSWDVDAPFMVDFSGKRPRFRIYAEAHKGRYDQYLPMTPDFATFLLDTPKAERTGRLFKLTGLQTGKPITHKRICRTVSDIGKAAGVIVNKATDKYATAHDLRRSFGTRWARRMTPAVLQRLMRHRTIETTMKYYVDLDADDISEQLWQEHGAMDLRVGTFVGSDDFQVDLADDATPQEAQKAL